MIPAREILNLRSEWSLDAGVIEWRRGFPFELIRYAGANRLKVDMDYAAKDGRWGARRVEPYSLRRTKDGNLLLFVVNDRAQLRSYSTERIVGVRPTNEVFRPRYLVEF